MAGAPIMQVQILLTAILENKAHKEIKMNPNCSVTVRILRTTPALSGIMREHRGNATSVIEAEGA